MFNYILRRLFMMVITLFGITVITFVVTRLAPGDPATLKLQFGSRAGRGGSQLTKRLIEETRKIYGFDKPIILNFRNENYKTEAKKLITTLEKGVLSDREDARVSIREISSLALPVIFERLEFLKQNSKTEKNKELYINLRTEIIQVLPSIIPENKIPEKIKDLSDEEEIISLWFSWWNENRKFYEEINNSKIKDALKIEDQKERENIFLSFGGYAVPYLIQNLISGGYSKVTNGDIISLRSSEALSSLVKKPWQLDNSKTSKETAENYDRWKRWWKNDKVRFSTFSMPEKIVRIFTATQFGIWVGKIVSLDFDVSYNYNRPVIELIKERLPVSIQLSIISIFLSYIIAIPLGIFSATHRNTLSDQIITIILFILYSLPLFWVATMLIMFTTGGDFPHIFPARYLHSIGYENFPFWKKLLDWLWHLVLPITCYTYGSFAFLSRQMRSSMLDVVKQDFIRTARAKGLSERVVIFKHALRNSLIPILTLSAVLLPELLGGSVIIEQIFSIDGMGKLTFEAILNRDYPVINAILFFSAFLTLVGILIADLSYAIADPRITYD